MKNFEEGLRLLDRVEADTKTVKDCLKDETTMLQPSSFNRALKKSLKGFPLCSGISGSHYPFCSGAP